MVTARTKTYPVESGVYVGDGSGGKLRNSLSDGKKICSTVELLVVPCLW